MRIFILCEFINVIFSSTMTNFLPSIVLFWKKVAHLAPLRHYIKNHLCEQYLKKLQLFALSSSIFPLYRI